MNRKIQKECESTCEYILPDYMGDIKKILNSKARVIPAGRFKDGEQLEINGVVEYEVLYSDSENKLTAVQTTSDYSMNVAVDGDNYIDSSDATTASNLSIRITGPRKMVIKSTVESFVTITEETDFKVEGDVFDGSREPEYVKRSVEYAESLYGMSAEREYAEEAERIPGVSAEEIEIITTGASVRITEARAVDGGVEIRGEIIAIAIIKTPEQPPYTIKKSIPFNETISIEGATADMSALADGYVTSATCGVNYDTNESVVVVNAIVEYKAEVIENKTIDVVSDAYLKEQGTKNSYSEIEYRRADGASIGEMTVDLKVARSELMLDTVQSILCADAEFLISEAKAWHNGVKFEGEINISGIACEINADNSVGFVPIKIKRPFEENVNISCQIPENSQIEYTVSTVECVPTLDSDFLYLRCVAGVKIKLFADEKMTCLTSCEVVEGEQFLKNTSSVTVYYPTESENLFDIAKRFHSSVAKIARDNSIAEETISLPDTPSSLSGLKKIIIR